MTELLVCISCILSASAMGVYLGWKIKRNKEILQAAEAQLAAKVNELELKEAEFTIKQEEFMRKDYESAKTIDALKKLVEAQDRLLDAYRDDELY